MLKRDYSMRKHGQASKNISVMYIDFQFKHNIDNARNGAFYVKKFKFDDN